MNHSLIKGKVFYDFDSDGDIENVAITVTENGQDYDQDVQRLGFDIEAFILDKLEQGQEIEIIIKFKRRRRGE